MLYVIDGGGIFVVSGDVVSDADGEQFDVRRFFDEGDDVTEVVVEVLSVVGGEGSIINGGAI